MAPGSIARASGNVDGRRDRRVLFLRVVAVRDHSLVGRACIVLPQRRPTSSVSGIAVLLAVLLALLVFVVLAFRGFGFLAWLAGAAALLLGWRLTGVTHRHCSPPARSR